jgi:hypothetical protein
MNDDDHVKLSGLYKPPALKVGARAVCLYRDAQVVVYGWSAGRIPWPLCYPAHTRAAGKGLLLDEELARAVRKESAAAIRYWWGVSGSTVIKWRKAVGADRKNNPGTQKLIRLAVQKATNSREVMQRRALLRRAEKAEQSLARLAALCRKALSRQASPAEMAELERLLQPPPPHA